MNFYLHLFYTKLLKRRKKRCGTNNNKNAFLCFVVKIRRIIFHFVDLNKTRWWTFTEKGCFEGHLKFNYFSDIAICIGYLYITGSRKKNTHKHYELEQGRLFFILNYFRCCCCWIFSLTSERMMIFRLFFRPLSVEEPIWKVTFHGQITI